MMVQFKNFGKFKIIGLVLLITLLNLSGYLAYELRGNIRYLPLTSENFGLPEYLKSKNIKPFYVGKSVWGWDGQFYYFMANDPLDQKSTAIHIDSPPYRYQRIGLSLIPFVISKVLGLDWVSPELFFFSYILLFIAGMAALGSILAKYKLSPWWIAAWGLFATTQVTMFNFLPDAAADIFLFIAVYYICVKENLFLYALAASLCALSRESYVIIFAGIFFTNIFQFLRIKSFNSFRALALAIPGVCFTCWQIWCTWHFKQTPSSLAYGVIGVPILDWLTNIRDAHTFADSVVMAIFLFFLIYQLYLLFLIWRKKQFLRPLVLCSSVVILLYLSFGVTVLSHWTGYLKPAALFVISIPLSLQVLEIRRSKTINILLGVFLTSTLGVLYCERLLPTISTSAITAGITRDFSLPNPSIPKTTSCLNPSVLNKFTIHLEKEEPFYDSEFIRKLFNRRYLNKMTFRIENKSQIPLPVAQHDGDIRLGYHLVNLETGLTEEGESRAFFPVSLMPDQSALLTLVVQMPQKQGRFQLMVSLLQESCFWFSEKDPQAVWSEKVNPR